MAQSTASPGVSFGERCKAARGAEIPNPHRQAEACAPAGDAAVLRGQRSEARRGAPPRARGCSGSDGAPSPEPMVVQMQVAKPTSKPAPRDSSPPPRQMTGCGEVSFFFN